MGRREEQRKYENDVFYDVWRSGGNPDVINYDRIEDHFYNGDCHETATRHELRAQRPPQQQEQYQEDGDCQIKNAGQCDICEDWEKCNHWI